MESPLSFLSTRAISPATTEGAPATPPARSGADGRDFAEVLTGETLKAQRQHLAALDGQGQRLQVLPLGNKLNVITSDAPLPDLDSLAQFARQQGLDEAAVQALFGAGLTTPVAPVAGLSIPTPVAATLPVFSADLQLGGSIPSPGPKPNATPASSSAADWAAAGIEIKIVAQAQPGGAAPPVPPSPLLAQQIPLAHNAPPAAAVATLPGAALPPAPILPAQSASADASMPMPTLTPAQAAGISAVAGAQSNLMPMNAQAWMGVGATAPVDATAASTDLAPQDALRLTLGMPAPEITKRLAQMSGTGKESTWAALLASGPVSKDLVEPATEALTLDVPPDYDLGLDILSPTSTESNNRDIATQAGATAPQAVAQAAAGGNAGSNAQAQADHRAQQFQQMADQMGQAAAQRLIAQIERGQWKMQMRMQPAALGTIKVELDMHAGGLDALFSADSAVTRELMAQGSNKLRDTLTSAGMTVASVTVNGDQTRQSGGNSTPGKGRSTPPRTEPVGGPLEATALAPRATDAAQADGLNVLA